MVKQIDKVKKQQQSNQEVPLSAWIFLILAFLYTISPVDLIPDIPIIGQIDDGIIDLTAICNFLEKAANIEYPSLSKIMKILKWIFFTLAVLLVLAILFFGITIVKLIQR